MIASRSIVRQAMVKSKPSALPKTLSGIRRPDRRLATGLDDVISGDSAANNLRGSYGDDILIGNGGGDTYHYARGDGRDIIRDNASDTTDQVGNKRLYYWRICASLPGRAEAMMSLSGFRKMAMRS